MLFASNYAIKINVMLINFAKWGRGTSEGVTRVTPYMALAAIYNSNHDHYSLNPPGTDRFKVKFTTVKHTLVYNGPESVAASEKSNTNPRFIAGRTL